MIRALTTSILIGLASLMAGCSTYVENEASLAFEPIYPSAHVTPEGEGPTGGIFKSSGGGLFASDIRARDVGDILTVALNDGTRRAAQPDDVTHIRWAFQKPIPVGGSGKLMFRGVVK